MPSIQLDKILENISIEKALYKNEEKSKKDEEDAWKRVASNNNITLHESKAIYNVLIRKFTTEKAKGNSTWKMFDIMQKIQEGHYEEPEKEKEENEGMIELMEVFEDEDSASDNNSELDKSNGSSGSKTSGISTRSSNGSSSNKVGSPEVVQKKLLNTTNMIPIASTNTPVSQKSQVFVPPNLQKVNLKPVGGFKKETPIKRKAEQILTTNAAIVKRPATFAAKPKPPAKSPLQAQIQQVSGSSEGSSTPDKNNKSPENSTIKVESTTSQIKTERVDNGYPEDQNAEEPEVKLPPNFFKHLCSSNRHEAFGLYLANFMNRLDKSTARKLELRLLQTITEFQAEHEN
ncbi:hypothetical protein ACFFRR_008780 [Megaselia abdita]